MKNVEAMVHLLLRLQLLVRLKDTVVGFHAAVSLVVGFQKVAFTTVMPLAGQSVACNSTHLETQ